MGREVDTMKNVNVEDTSAAASDMTSVMAELGDGLTDYVLASGTAYDLSAYAGEGFSSTVLLSRDSCQSLVSGYLST